MLFKPSYGDRSMDKKRILIVDDEPDLVETLQVRLAQENYECLTANDGHNGFELARTEKPDLVILDIMLPGMDGYKVARLLKFQKELKHIPIIMLSARDRD
jgi:DNA-binding response OmpR family regulator